MKVSKLIKILSNLEPDTIVLIGKNRLTLRVETLDEYETGYYYQVDEDEIDFVTDLDVSNDRQINLSGFQRAVCLWSES